MENLLEIGKYLLYLISVGIGFYYARYLKFFIRWIMGGIENGDGKLQNKELQIAFFSLISAFIVVSIAFWDVVYPDSVIYCVFAGAGILYAVKTFADVKNNENKK